MYCFFAEKNGTKTINRIMNDVPTQFCKVIMMVKIVCEKLIFEHRD